MSTLPLLNPKSVIKLAPSSGVFGRPNLDENEFTAIVMGCWIKRASQAKNAVSETPQHFEEARNLYDFYKIYRATHGLSRGSALYKLYSKGCISEATETLLAGNKKRPVFNSLEASGVLAGQSYE